mmetsp:Transcript_113748/g.328467  ORF Transcript_113748/g.328467 Transcript_113748/m.328467 type:complete len:451 (+) Transcript_113748:104-1456(+)|eukprot:CAMPEP_0176055798 /NCGR_PEP_ID=MMETSP0120_2-20121206/27782_1 /TAXON_ID=160619 /ORGANISM="Kryptoperidinium foliaceum, Strain CCMP 1326" /LENGTH=450 /DNA_ID=CAMNT_0017389297 /DNA_START=37 /DNA_END=1389 /DNA_ORIENTATION=+
MAPSRSTSLTGRIAKTIAVANVAGIVVQGLMLEGELPRSQDFSLYVGKFCYDFSPSMDPIGTVDMQLTRDSDLPSQSEGKLFFVIYDDERMHWRRIRDRWDSATCQEKIEAASVRSWVQLWTTDRKANFTIHLKEHIRPRWWYFTFINCGAEVENVRLRYSIHATNDKVGSFGEFSIDELGLWKVYLAATAAFTGAAYITHRWARKQTQDAVMRDHPYIQLLLLSYAASWFSAILFLLHYTIYMYDGFGSKRLRFFAIFAGIVANCTIYLIAILSSCGWAITTATLPYRRSFLGLVTFVGCLHAMCELNAQTTLDQSTTLHAYAGGVGVFSLILKVFIFCWFAFQVKHSYEMEMDTRRRLFFKYHGIGVSLWALTVPVVVLLAFRVSPWVRYKWVTGVEIFARFLGQCLLTQLFLGPLSPLDDGNTFRFRGHEEAMEVSGGRGGFGNLPG